MKVEDLMTTPVIAVDEDESIEKVAKLMKEYNIGTVVVTKNERISGIVTDRDIVVRGVANGIDVKKPVKEIMTKNVVYGRREMEVLEACELMGKNKIRRLPIVDEEKRVVGMLSIADVAQYIRYLSCWVLDEIAKSRKKEIARGRPSY